MKNNIDFKKEWEKAKKKLVEFSKEAAEIAKKGEKEISKITHQSKLHIDSTAMNLKKEKLYYMIGKEYVKSRNPEKPSAKLKKLVAEVRDLDKGQRNLKKQIKKVPKKAPKKNVQKKS